MLKTTLTVMLYLFANIFTQSAFADHQLTVSSAWIADAPPVVKIRAGYLKLHNKGTHTIRIKDFSSPDFSHIELHKTVAENNMVRMEEIKHLSIKPGQEIEFKPGSYHLMLFTPQKKLKVGNSIKLSIRLIDDSTSSFTAVIRERGDSMQHDHQHHNHH